MFTRLSIWIAAIICGATSLCQASNLDFSKMELEAGYATGKFISIKRDYAELGLFAPLGIDQTWEPFVDARGYRFKDGRWAASAGVGLRAACAEAKAWGVNAYWDYLRGAGRKNFYRAGMGAEWLTNCYDMRINAYIPFGCRTQQVGSRFFRDADSDFLALAKRFQYAYTGFDAEIGKWLFVNKALSLYLAGGPYYYTRQHFEHFWGGYARAEVNWRSLVSLQARASYDHVYSIHAQALVLITLPLDLFADFTCAYKTLMGQRVHRTGIVLTGERCCCWSGN